MNSEIVLMLQCQIKAPISKDLDVSTLIQDREQRE
jgi:hypothetical protein